ncbi:MAG: hypothetical protein OXU33_07160 [Gemmatimonadota bacterium]|nr:hypothetical protein [Gemmatimonadota bacterium]MDE3005323.1 hypothetical protein [Gemmatimonadota bacterium]MDE3013836.1 hypothetical protein [Gemmatimonadota bacterium]
MKRILGMGVGVVYLGIAFGALNRASAGWETGYSDIGFWWTVIAVLLTIAACGALIGTWIHTQEGSR